MFQSHTGIDRHIVSGPPPPEFRLCVEVEFILNLNHGRCRISYTFRSRSSLKIVKKDPPIGNTSPRYQTGMTWPSKNVGPTLGENGTPTILK